MSEWLDTSGALWVDVRELAAKPSEHPIRWRITDTSCGWSLTLRIPGKKDQERLTQRRIGG